MARHKRDIADLARIAERDLMILLDPGADAIATRNLLMAALPDLVSVYGSAAATLAADFYDELREGAKARGRFLAVPATLPDVGRTDSLAQWAVSPLFSADPDYEAMATKTAGGLQRIVTNADRETVMGSAIRDPGARGWRRMTSPSACEFCSMIADRDPVYTESSADFETHDHCGCVAVPEFG